MSASIENKPEHEVMHVEGINANFGARVRLTPAGAEQYNKYLAELHRSSETHFPLRQVATGEEINHPIAYLMEEFGDAMGAGMPSVFEGDEMTITDYKNPEGRKLHTTDNIYVQVNLNGEEMYKRKFGEAPQRVGALAKMSFATAAYAFGSLMLVGEGRNLPMKTDFFLPPSPIKNK